MILFRNRKGQIPEWKKFVTESMTPTAERMFEKEDETIKSKDDQIKELQGEVAKLNEKVEALKKDFDSFRKDSGFPKYHGRPHCPGKLTWNAGTYCDKCE